MRQTDRQAARPRHHQQVYKHVYYATTVSIVFHHRFTFHLFHLFYVLLLVSFCCVAICNRRCLESDASERASFQRCSAVCWQNPSESGCCRYWQRALPVCIGADYHQRLRCRARGQRFYLFIIRSKPFETVVFGWLVDYGKQS